MPITPTVQIVALTAAIIMLVGCFQGFRTEGGADGVGQQTTRSVVWSIFLVIVAAQRQKKRNAASPGI